MCSIEEAWAGQNFDGYRVQSQADLRRKYMPISDDMLTRNNEFTVTKKEPVSRMGNQGINTKMVRPLQVAPLHSSGSQGSLGSAGDNAMSLSFAENQMPMDNYGGLEPRPGYMSIYDNAGQGMPMPTQTQNHAGRSAFGDINQAFQVSPVVDRFMANGDSNSNSNFLLNENSNDDQLMLIKKINSANSNSSNNNNSNNSKNNHIEHQTMQSLSKLNASLQDILIRIERVERELHNGASRNMCDMVLYVLVGMLISFILYSLLRK